MKLLRLLALLLPLVCLAADDALAQRGGRDDGSRRRPTSRKRASERPAFLDRLWYGAGGTLNFGSFNGTSQARIGLSPQVGYKATEWLSFGPRLSLTYNTIKGPSSDNVNRRVNLWDVGAGGFVRGRVLMFYGQAELGYESVGQTSVVFDQFGRQVLFVDPSTGEVETSRQGQTQLLVGVGYNPSQGGRALSSDIGIFYNVFDDATNIFTTPWVFRIMLTYGY